MTDLNPDMRLYSCIELVKGDFVCDIGTDHGILPAFLLFTGRCRRAIASDVNEGPLDAAEATLRQAEVLDRCDLYLTDGLDDIPMKGITDVVIAGMGGDTIAGIMNCEKAKCGAAFILQPMSKADNLRTFLAASGFEVTEEKGSVQGDFAYTAMRCQYTGVPYAISSMRKITGLLDPSRDQDREYIKRQLFRINVMAEGMANSRPERSLELRELIDTIGKETGICLP